MVSLAARVLNVASVEQIRRRRSARLKGMFFFVRKGWQDYNYNYKMNRVDVGASL